jgi:hypothetical protein
VLLKLLGKSAASLVVLGAIGLALPAQAQLPSPPLLWTRPVNSPVIKRPVAKKRSTIKKPVDRSYQFNASSSQFNRVENPINDEQRQFQRQYAQSRCRSVCFTPGPGSPIPLNREVSSGGRSGIAIEARTEF